MSIKHCFEGVYWLHDFFGHWACSRKTREQLEAMQRGKFRKLVRYAAAHSRFYAELVQRLDIDVEDCRLEDFPVLVKEQMMENFDRIVTDRRITRARVERFLTHSSDPTELLDGEFYVVNTSGSSGRVGYCVCTSREWIRGCSHQIRLLGGLGLRRRIAFVSVSAGHYTGVSMAMTGKRFINRLFFHPRAFDVNRPVPELVEELNRFQPHSLIGYGVTLHMLALEQARGRLAIQPHRVISSGEPLLSGSKDFIERAFGAPVTNVYASSEHLLMGAGQPESEEMYLFEDDLIFECHDDHVCVTNLFNRTLPLIRYRMEDVLTPVDRQSGRHPFRIVKNVVGRNERPLVLQNEHGQQEFIHPLAVVDLFIRHVLAFQIKVIDSTSFVFRVRLEPGIHDQQRREARAEITQKIRALLEPKQLLASVTFRIEEVESLEVDPQSGKFRVIETDQTYPVLSRQPLDKVA